MKQAPIQFPDYFLLTSLVAANPNWDSLEDEGKNIDLETIEIQSSMNSEGSEEDWNIFLALRTKKDEEEWLPYSIDLALVGFFSVTGNESIDRDGLFQQGLFRLFGILRELLRDLTTRGPYDTVLLPEPDFSEIMENSIIEIEEEPKKKSHKSGSKKNKRED